MEEAYSNRVIKLVTGETVYRETVAVVGYCHSSLHPGYLTKSILKHKQCLEKHCDRLERFEDCSFWKNRQKHLDKRRMAKQEKKQAKLQRTQQQEETLDLLADVMAFSSQMVKAYDFPIVLTGVAKAREPDGTGKLIVNFVSAQPIRDDWKFRDLGELVSERFHMYVQLRHTRKPNGEYATTEDLFLK